MRLIDADATMREFAEFVKASNNSDFAKVPTWNDAVSLLGSAPTIDPVKRGRWVKAERDGCLTYSESYKQCSECGKVTFLAEKMNYCPNCGARMQEGEEDE